MNRSVSVWPLSLRAHWASAMLVVAALGLGGVLSSVGAVIYAHKRPDPVPTVFGYHELFHLLVIVAAALQYAVVAFWIL